MRSVVRFLDNDSSGTIDVGEIDKAVREFRELVRDTPSLGTGPMTVIDSAEIDRFARKTFADLVANHSSPGKDGKILHADADTTATTTNNSSSNDNNDNLNDKTAVGYTTSEEEGDDDQVLPAAAAAAATKGQPPKTDQALAGGEASGGDVDSDNEDEARQPTVSVSEISAAFAEALRQFKTGGEGQHSSRAMRRAAEQQPSTDTQHAKVPRPSLCSNNPEATTRSTMPVCHRLYVAWAC